MKPTKPNPYAKALRSPHLRQQVVKDKKKSYSQKKCRKNKIILDE